MEILRGIFPNHLITRFGDISCPARSPDLSVAYIFLWICLKERIFANRLYTTDGLKIIIQREVQLIALKILRNVRENFIKRLNQCITKSRRHLYDMIFKTK